MGILGDILRWIDANEVTLDVKMFSTIFSYLRFEEKIRRS